MANICFMFSNYFAQKFIFEKEKRERENLKAIMDQKLTLHNAIRGKNVEAVRIV